MLLQGSHPDLMKVMIRDSLISLIFVCNFVANALAYAKIDSFL